MIRTLFAGLTQLDPAEPLSTDGYSFQAVNPNIIDRLLEVGAVTHRHDGHDALADPVLPPSAVALPAGGSIPAGATASFVYTLLDADRGETAQSPLATVTTAAAMGPPSLAPVAVADYTGGSLSPDTYYYGHTWIDVDGGETTMDAIAVVDVDTSPAQVQLSGLTDGIPVGAVGWKLYRAVGGASFHYITTGAADTLTDDGTLCANCDQRPPTASTAASSNSIEVTVPDMPDGAVSWRLYGTLAGTFTTPAFLASGTVGDTVTLTVWSPTFGAPPARSLSLRGAAQIDPDTDLFDWHWLRPVATWGALPAAASGDARVTIDTGDIWVYTNGEWAKPDAAAAGFAVAGSAGVGVLTDRDYVEFRGTGSAAVTVQDLGGGSAAVTINAPRGAAYRMGHTFALMGDVEVASGQTGAVPPFFVAHEPGYTPRIVKARHRLGAGSATVKLQRNGADIPGYTAIAVGGVAADTTGSAAVAQDDAVQLVVDAVAGAPENLSLTVNLEATPPG